MNMSAIKNIEQTVLALPLKERAQLAESLLESLPPIGNVWSEAEELAEAERREGEIATGKVQPITENEFWKRVEARRKR
jgi:putative addiction module component (TIGR02574 family)